MSHRSDQALGALDPRQENAGGCPTKANTILHCGGDVCRVAGTCRCLCAGCEVSAGRLGRRMQDLWGVPLGSVQATRARVEFMRRALDDDAMERGVGAYDAGAALRAR